MSGDQEYVVTARDVSIFQSGQTILDNINFNIHKGEFVFLVGRTGGGKSSLLKTIYADLPLQLGEMNVAGYAIHSIKRSEIPGLRRKIGIVFQDFQLFPDRSVTENLMFVMKATGWKEKSKMKTRLTEVLVRVGLGSAGSKMPHQLSGGEQQRIAIARALVIDPQVLIADEPTGNLDPALSVEIMRLFERFNDVGVTLLIATHNLELLERIGHRRIELNGGKLVRDSGR